MVRRRRIRPGARKRHALKGHALQGHLSSELREGLGMARDQTLSLPCESPLRQNYERSWRAWKTRESEQRTELQEKEHYRLFGGEVDDDVSLCSSMLDVVYSLWGDIDYTDP